DLQAASDTGVSSTDNKTNDTTPTFSGVGPASISNLTIELLVDGTVKGSATASGTSGAWTITTSALASGTHSITARSKNGVEVSNESSALSVVIDASAPAAPSKPDLDTASDTGSSTSDNITGDTTPTFNG